MGSNTTSTPLTVAEIKDPSDLVPWTKAMYAAFVGTDNVLAETLFGLPPGVMPSQSQLDSAVEEHHKALTGPQAHGGENRYIQILDSITGEIMGGTKWTFFSDAPKRPERVDVNWIDGSTSKGKFERDYAQATMDEFHSRRVKHMNCPHALLHICFTSPDYERRGVGSAMVRWGLERADEEGWRSFTEASPRGGPVYARLGFETREAVRLRWDERGEDWKKKEDVRWTFMERPPVEKDTN
jgi:GNAT superfamily N-acetyltransferase